LDLEPAHVFLSTAPATPRQRRYALVVILVALVVFVLVVPFAKTPLPQAPAFVPLLEVALVVINLITAVLLFGQFAILRSWALLVLAAGYLFAATMAVPHILVFPAHLVWPGPGQHVANWLFVFWRLGFEAFLIAYVLLRLTDAPPMRRWRARRVIIASIAAVVIATIVLAVIAGVAAPALPSLLEDDRIGFSSTVRLVGTVALIAGLVCLVLMWLRRQQSVLDVWLLVMFGLLFLAGMLSTLLNAGMFDLGFYVGRTLGVIGLSFVLINLLIEYGRLYAKLAAGQHELRRLSGLDPLTGVANRRAFDQAIEAEWNRLGQDRATLSVLLIDVDCFKSFNDAQGHPAGDACLSAVAHALAAASVRRGGMAARYGGDEFAVLLPQTDEAAALELAEQLRTAVRALNIPHPSSPVAARVTISVGVASVSVPGTKTAFAVLIAAADKALYGAKAAGRDCVQAVAEGQGAPEVPDSLGQGI
jgi:diguanylate cyclase (GGDEF)-like protein